jgi:hypothetical protein
VVDVISVTVRTGGGVGGQMGVQPTRMQAVEGATVAGLLDRWKEATAQDLTCPCRRVSEEESRTWTLMDGGVVSEVAATAGG